MSQSQFLSASGRAEYQRSLDLLLDPVAQRSWPADVRRAFHLRRVEVGTGAIPALAEWARFRGFDRALVVVDERTYAAAGERAGQALRDAGLHVDWHRLTEPEGHDPGADEQEVERARDAVQSSRPDVLIAVGAGTVTDVAKMAATQVDLPWLSVPTAPSMNGYTSGIAAILVKGVKRTLPARQTEAVFGDVGVLAAAPEALVAAGFADLSSKPLSNACWILASAVTGAPYSDAASQLLDAPFRALMERARGVGERHPAAMEALILTLVLSGCSMAIAGSSAPASGGEHLISHYWDMVEHVAGRPVRALHGLQVGVATVLSAKMYERIVGHDVGALILNETRLHALAQSWPATEAEQEARVRRRHPDLSPQVLDEVVAQALGKFLPRDQARETLAALGAAWNDVGSRLNSSLVPSEVMIEWLSLAKAPIFADQLGVDDSTLAHTVLVCADIRSRYTVWDFASALGLLEPFSVELVATASR